MLKLGLDSWNGQKKKMGNSAGGRRPTAGSRRLTASGQKFLVPRSGYRRPTAGGRRLTVGSGQGGQDKVLNGLKTYYKPF